MFVGRGEFLHVEVSKVLQGFVNFIRAFNIRDGVAELREGIFLLIYVVFGGVWFISLVGSGFAVQELVERAIIYPHLKFVQVVRNSSDS